MLELNRGRCAKWRWTKTEPADCDLMLNTCQKRSWLHTWECVSRHRRQAVRVLGLSPKTVPVMIDDIVSMVLMIDRRVA